MDNLLKPHTWIGTFYPPKQSDKSFGGKLTYTPEKGPSLEYATPLQYTENTKNKYLCGILSNGEPCMLAGTFDTAISGFSMKNGYCSFHGTSHRFSYLLLGAQFSPDQTYDSFRFCITGLQEFFTDDLQNTPYQSKAITKSELDLGDIEISLSATGLGLQGSLDKQLICNDKVALAQLQEAYNEIKNKHPDVKFFIKKETNYQITLKLKKALTILDAYIIARKINDLFSLIFFSPTQIEYFDAIARTKNGHPVYLPVFISNPSDMSTIEKSKTKKHHHNLPINSRNTNLGSLISSWMEISENHETITTQIQGQRNSISLHEIYSSITMNVAQLEGIAASNNGGTDKYNYAINTYATSKAKGFLISLLGQDKAPGVLIFDLRNEIVHPKKPKKLLHNLNWIKLFKVSICLELIIARYALDETKLPIEVQESYMNYWIEQTDGWH